MRIYQPAAAAERRAAGTFAASAAGTDGTSAGALAIPSAQVAEEARRKAGEDILAQAAKERRRQDLERERIERTRDVVDSAWMSLE